MSFGLAVFVVVAFAVTIERLHLPKKAREVGSRATASLELLRDASLTDDHKERALQQEAAQLFRLFAILSGGGLLAIILPLAAVWGLDLLGLASLGEVLSVLERIDFLVGMSLVGGFYFLVHRWTGGAT